MIQILLLIILLFINSISFFSPILDSALPSLNTLLPLLIIIILIINRSKIEDIETNIESIATVIKEEAIQPNIQEKPEKELKSAEYFGFDMSRFIDKFYYFKESIPIIEALSKSTQKFEEETLKKVFNQFELIWNESKTIFSESEKSMESIFDSNNSTNLGYILNSSKEINDDFKNFLPVLDSMNTLTEQFANISMDSFKTINKTTKEIEDLAEQVKVISINVRIEAARIEDSGGFKVLGSDITKFADKTSLFAKSTNDKIQNTIDTIDTLKNELTGKLKDVSNIAKGIYVKVNPFETILESSAKSLKLVIGNFNKVSGELNSNLKTSLGNLQFQDVTSQESGHIITFLKHIESLILTSDKLLASLSEDEKREIKKDLLAYLDKISTTGNEADRIKEFGEIWNVKYKDEHHESFNDIDDGTFLF